MKSPSFLLLTLASLLASAHAQYFPLQPVRVPGKAVSFAAAHLFPNAGSFPTLAEKTDQSLLNAAASSSYANLPRLAWSGSASVMMDNANHDFHLAASLIMQRPSAEPIVVTTDYVAGYATALHEDRLYFTSAHSYPFPVVAHLRFRMFDSPTPRGDGLVKSIRMYLDSSEPYTVAKSTRPQPSLAGDYDFPMSLVFSGYQFFVLGEQVSYTVAADYGVELAYCSTTTAAAQVPPDAGLFLRTIEFTDVQGRRLNLDGIRITSESGFDYNAFINAEHGRFVKPDGGYRGLISRPSAGGLSPDLDGLFSARSTGRSLTMAFTFQGEKFALRGTVNGPGPVTFSDGTAVKILRRKGSALDYPFQLRLVQNGDAYSLVGGIEDRQWVMEASLRPWTIDARHAVYSAKPNRAGGYQGVPVRLVGKYTALFQSNDLPSSGFPQGAGWALLRVRANGDVTLAGRLADGATVSHAGALTERGLWPFEAPLYEGRGRLIGLVDFLSAETGEFVSNVRWLRPAIANSNYPAGWPYGIDLTMRGSKFAQTGALGSTPTFPGLRAPGPSGNALFFFSGIGGEGFLSAPVSIGNDDRITVLAPNPERLVAFINPADGRVVGQLGTNKFSGVILQKQQRAGGWLQGGSKNPRFRVTPAP